MKLKDFERNPQDAVRKNITSGREGVRVICGRVQIPGKGMFTMLTLRKVSSVFGQVRRQDWLCPPGIESSWHAVQGMN